MTQHGERYFFFFSLALFLIVVFSFPMHALVNGDDLPPMRPLLHIHAISLGSWYGLMVIQTGLIGAGRSDLHRRLGIFSLILVGVMLPTGLWVSYENMIRTESGRILTVNAMNVAQFLGFYSAALIWRNRPTFHKRAMLLAGLALMLPAYARLMYVFDLSPFLSLPLWLGFLLSMPVYDMMKDRRIHLATGIGLAVNVAYIAILLAMGPPTRV